MNASLPIIQVSTRTTRWRLYLVQTLRVLLIALLLIAIPKPATEPRDGLVPPTVDELINTGHSLPPDCVVGPRDPSSGLWRLEDVKGNTIGWVARTFPDAQHAIGYRGPTEASILLNHDLRVLSVRLLSSEDTDEHVEAVSGSSQFFEQFVDWDWASIPGTHSIDGVSGATLTSLALTEGIARRMGGDVPSLVFAKTLDLADAKVFFPNAAALNAETGGVFDAAQSLLGYVIRTGDLADSLIGYQGPTELLIKLNLEGTIDAVKIRTSFDNEPYVDYVRTEYGFWKRFRGMDLATLARFDPVAERVEGVSGATMTSQTVAHTLAAAAKEYQNRLAEKERPDTDSVFDLRWSWTDLATVTVLVLAILMQFSILKRFRRHRRIWLLIVVLVVGFWSGNLISMALLAGWSAEGIAWRLAPGLACVAVVATLSPIFTKQNLYCNHLCPHGAIQQLVKPRRVSRQWKWIRSHVGLRLSLVPPATLLCAYATLSLYPAFDLSGWEPFHAYLFRVSSWTVILYAVVTIVISRYLPMAYCRYACPTGFFLSHLRLHSGSGVFRRADFVILMTVVIVWMAKGISTG